MNASLKVGSIEWFIEAIKALPADEPVPPGTQGYNRYTTQKAHWLGWLDPASGTGSYPRSASPDRDAKYVYNHIMEPKLLLWLAEAAQVDGELLANAKANALLVKSMAGQAAAIRKVIPWAIVFEKLMS